MDPISLLFLIVTTYWATTLAGWLLFGRCRWDHGIERVWNRIRYPFR
jgi:hypothetical protein